MIDIVNPNKLRSLFLEAKKRIRKSLPVICVGLLGVVCGAGGMMYEVNSSQIVNLYVDQYGLGMKVTGKCISTEGITMYGAGNGIRYDSVQNLTPLFVTIELGLRQLRQPMPSDRPYSQATSS